MVRIGFQKIEVLVERFVVLRGRRTNLLRKIVGDSNVVVDHWRVTDAESNVNCRTVCPQGLESGLARWMGAPVFRY